MSSANPSHELLDQMAKALAGAGIDLGDERACIRALMEKFQYGDVVRFCDLARQQAGASR